MTVAVKNVSSDNLRDLRIMARQGKAFDYILSVFGWPDRLLHELCAVHGITIQNAPPSPHVARRRATVDPSPVRVPAAGCAPDSRPRGYTKIPSAQARTVRLQAITTRAIANEVARQSALRGIASGALVHSVLAAAQKRGLWSDLLDSVSVPVASASHPNQNNETQ